MADGEKIAAEVIAARFREAIDQLEAVGIPRDVIVAGVELELKRLKAERTAGPVTRQ